MIDNNGKVGDLEVQIMDDTISNSELSDKLSLMPSQEVFGLYERIQICPFGVSDSKLRIFGEYFVNKFLEEDYEL